MWVRSIDGKSECTVKMTKLRSFMLCSILLCFLESLSKPSPNPYSFASSTVSIPTWPPPNLSALFLANLKQQMTRSQQMDELLDVLIESGGKIALPTVHEDPSYLWSL